MKIIVAEEDNAPPAIIKVIGVGGAGGNAINRMAEHGIRGVELISANSDAQALRANQAEIKIQIGETLTQGLGVGGDAMKGKMAAMESEGQIREVLTGAHLVFITTGMGGGTGTGAAPVVSSIAKELGALTIGVVTRPFHFEGLTRADIAEKGIHEMRQNVDALLVIPNEKLFEIIDKDTLSENAFRMADDVLRRAIQTISDMITTSGFINMDLNDMRAIMKDAGDALIGLGEASGPGRAVRAAKEAVESPLLENIVIDGAKGLIVNVSGGHGNLKLSEIDEIMSVITGKASPDAKIKLGKAYDESLAREDKIRITVIATGFPARRLVRPYGRPSGRPDVYGEPFQPSGGFDLDAGRLTAATSPEEWAKPAYLRLKTRKLK